MAILGLGLMGGSLGMALRASGRAVAGYDAAPGVAERARERGAIDVAAGSVEEAVAGAALVVLAAPVLAIRELLAAVAPLLAQATPDALVTDLGSAKARVCEWAEELLSEPERFVGGHPMTGRERSGVEAAEPDLYRGCAWCLTPASRTPSAAIERIASLVAELGARPLTLDPARHDAAVALISHLPLVAASGLVLAASAAPDWALARTLAAGGFRDTTRVASGDPRMARDICLANTGPLLAALDGYLATLQRLREQIAAGNPAIEEAFAAAGRERDQWLDKRGRT